MTKNISWIMLLSHICTYETVRAPSPDHPHFIINDRAYTFYVSKYKTMAFVIVMHLKCIIRLKINIVFQIPNPFLRNKWEHNAEILLHCISKNSNVFEWHFRNILSLMKTLFVTFFVLKWGFIFGISLILHITHIIHYAYTRVSH